MKKQWQDLEEPIQDFCVCEGEQHTILSNFLPKNRMNFGVRWHWALAMVLVLADITSL